MKLTTAMYTAAFILVPAVGFAVDQSARHQDMKVAGDKSYPYPDWPAIAKTAEPSPQNGGDQQKATEQSASSGNKGEPSLLEKAGRALEAVTGSSPTTKEGSSQVGASQLKPTTTDQSARQQDRNMAYPYPDWPAIAKTEESSPQMGADQQKAAERSASSRSNGEPSLLEKAGHAIETITGRSVTKEGPSHEGPAAGDQNARQQDNKAAIDKSYPYPDWPAIAKTEPASQGSKE
jgi:hypothetical protein